LKELKEMGERSQYEISELIAAGKLVIGDGYRARNEELSSGGIPFARAGNINNGFQFSDADHFPEGSLHRVGNKVSQPGDVVFTSKGTVGRFAFVRPETPRFVYSPQLCFWRAVDKERIHPRFLYYWMHGREFFLQFKGVAGQTDMADYVSLTDQRRMHITLPDSREQRSIATVLGSLDDKIDLNQRMNETLEATASAIFKDWFVDFGPVRSKVERRQPYLAKEIWAIFPNGLDREDRPNGWGERPVYEIAEFVNGAAYKDMHFSPEREGLPVVKIVELKNGVTASTKFTITDLGNKYRIDTNEILLSWSGNPDTSIDTFIWCDGRAWLNQHIFRVRENGSATRAMIYFQLKQLKPVFAEIARNKQTTGLGHVTAADMKALKVCAPPSAVAIAYERIVGPVFERICSNLLENRTLERLRDLLLPKLMSGELRLGESEKLVEKVA
jgi:type I restriction enzyme, S subunit